MWIIIISVSVALLAAAFVVLTLGVFSWVAQGKTGAGPSKPETLTRWGIVFLGVGTAAVLGAALLPWLLGAVLLVGSSVIAGCLILAGVVRVATLPSHRQAVEQIVIGQLAAVVRQNLPLATAITLAAQSERGSARAILHRIGLLAGQGLSMSECLRLGYPTLDSLVRSMISAGENAGQLPAALNHVETWLLDRGRRGLGPQVVPWEYFLVVVGFLMLVVTGLMVAVVPKFKEIFKDYDTILPGLTVSLINVSEWFVTGTPPGWVILLPIPVLIVIHFYTSVRPRQLPEPAWTSRLADHLRWRTPGLGRAEFHRGMAAAMRVFGLGVRAGLPLATAAGLASEIDVNVNLRRHLRRFAELLEGGKPVAESAGQAQLGSVAVTSLAAGQRIGSLAEPLRYVADYHQAVVVRLWTAVRSLAAPLLTLVVGIGVGYVVLALFLPLISLINATTGSVGR